MNKGSEENINDEFETIARETLDRIIEIIENGNYQTELLT